MSPPSGASPASQGKWQPLQNAATPLGRRVPGSAAPFTPFVVAGRAGHHLLGIVDVDPLEELGGGLAAQDRHHLSVPADRNLSGLPNLKGEAEIGTGLRAQLTSRPRLAKRVNSGWKVISTVPVAPERCFSMISSAIPFFS